MPPQGALTNPPSPVALAPPPPQTVAQAVTCDLAHLDQDVAQAAAAAGVAKAAAAATNKRCPCPNCRANSLTAKGSAAGKGSGSYAKNVGAKQQQAGAAAQKAGSRKERKDTPIFNVSALPAKPLMTTAGKKEVEGAKVGAGSFGRMLKQCCQCCGYPHNIMILCS
jgi:hypothetical protein